MRATLPGISGSLFPGRYLVDQLLIDARADLHAHDDSITAQHREGMRRRLRHWWRNVTATCGPASGVRALFDIGAMPLAAALGFRASTADFSARMARARLDPRAAHDHAGAPVALLVAPWAHRSPAIWRDAATHARDCGASWCLIFAPPHLQILDATTWSRRVVEFTFPDVIDCSDSFDRLLALAGAAALTTNGGRHIPRIAHLIARGEAFQDAVREDLQLGVADSLDVLARVVPGRDEPLAIIYRVLFLLFAESRDLLPWQHPLYGPAYSMSTMCGAACADPRAPGFWTGLAAVSRLLRIGCRTPELDVRPFNGHLFSRAAVPSLERQPQHRGTRAAAEDRAIADTLIQLSTRPARHGRESITYHDLGVEQLGGVYERVLGHPHRKQSGSFYTPRALTEFVVRRTLTPLTRNAAADDILALRVVDPAMGSGAFLVAACHHLADAYHRALVRERRVAEHEVDDAMQAEFRRLVAQRCLYGVDRNPVAVQLSRLSLWLATLAGGKPLTFLDHRLRTGDALVGARPQDLRHVTARATSRPMPLFDVEAERDFGCVAAPLLAMAAEPDDTVETVRRKEALWSRLSRDASALSRWRLAAHLWCARWFADGDAATSVAEVRAAIDAVLRGDGTLPAATLARRLRAAGSAAERHRFFHWPIEFADAFVDADGHPRADAGFDAVIGNPPWEMLRDDHGEGGTPAQLVRFIRGCGQYVACGRGHVNLYQPFLERALDLTRAGGQVGLVLPWGLASDDGAAALRTRLLDRCRTSTVVGFDNAGAIFPVHRGVRFLALVTSPGGGTDELPMRGGIASAAEIERLCDDEGEMVAPMRISRGTLAMAGGALRRIPDLRRPHDAQLLDELTRRFPALGRADGWRAEFGRELNVTEDRDAFGDRGWPVIEGKHIQPFTADVNAPRFRITASALARAMPGRAVARARLAYRDVSAVSNRQSLIAAIVPANVVTTHTLFCLKTALDPERQHFLCACFNSYVLNAVVRLLMGGHLTTSLVESLPVPPWTGSRLQRTIARLSRRLSERGPSVRLAARLQARVAQEYGVDHDTFGRILATFPIIPESERLDALSQLKDISTAMSGGFSAGNGGVRTRRTK